ncbi:MAG: hypothetical protein ACOYYS_07365 [Chloroflexota bacterium]
MKTTRYQLPTFSGLSTAQLWPLIVLAGFAFMVSLVPLAPNDFWWHLKIGEIVFTQGYVPETNLFGWTLPADAPFFYGAWLGEYLLYVLYHGGQLALVTFARNVMIVAAYWLVAYESVRRSRSWRLAALAVAVVALSTINNMIVRPQIWSWLPFMGFLVLLSRYADRQLRRRWLLALPLIMVFWVNAHGAFITGLVMIGIFFVGEAVRTALKAEGALRWQQVAWIGAIGLLCGLATVINPRFFDIFAYVQDLMTDRPSQRLIEEWQSPTPTGIANGVFYASILLLLAAFAYTRYRPTPSDVLLLGGFLWLAWSGQRYVIWFEMIALPIICQALAALPVKMPRLIPQKNRLNALLAALLFVPVLMVQPWFVENVPLPERYWAIVQRHAPAGPLIDRATPLGAAEYLRQHPGGKLFQEMGYGSYLIWAVPEQGVFIDPRVELYPYEQWQDYIEINRGYRHNELLETYGADRILLDKNIQAQLAGALANDPLWKMEYEDAISQIWRRVQP